MFAAGRGEGESSLEDLSFLQVYLTHLSEAVHNIYLI